MKALPISRVWLVALMLLTAVFVAPVHAEQAPASPTPWQEVISSQIQAFRDHDAPTAFSYAGLGFQATFPDAETFFATIIQSGYAPIMESRYHSFGEHKMIGSMGVVQQVRFVGNNQMLYDAVFQLTEESGGWRVQGVQLLPPKGVAV